MAYTSTQVKQADAALKRKAEENRKARIQATKDALYKPPPLEIKLVPGEDLTLHQLNILSRRAVKTEEEIIHETAVTVAKAVKQSLSSLRTPTGPVGRPRRSVNQETRSDRNVER